MKRYLVMLLAVLSTQGLVANSRGCYDNSNCGVTDCCNDWNFCDANFYAAVDWLYWKARRCDLDLATINGVTPLTNLLADIATPGRTVCLDHKYRSGVRVAAGMEWCSGFGFGFEYTYFNPNEHTRVAVDGVADVVTLTRVPGLLVPGVGARTVLGVDGRFDLKLNLLDLLFTYKYGCNPCRDVRAFFGARLAWIDDRLLTTYSGAIVTTGVPLYELDLFEKNNLNAYGLTVGGQVFQDLFCSLGVYLKAGFSVLYGSYDLQSRTRYVTTSVVTPFPGYNVKDDCSCLLSTLDLAFGLGFKGCEFCCARWSLFVGYEFHNWFEYRDYLRPLTDATTLLNVYVRNKSDLGFDGLFVRLGVEF